MERCHWPSEPAAKLGLGASNWLVGPALARPSHPAPTHETASFQRSHQRNKIAHN